MYTAHYIPITAHVHHMVVTWWSHGGHLICRLWVDTSNSVLEGKVVQGHCQWVIITRNMSYRANNVSLYVHVSKFDTRIPMLDQLHTHIHNTGMDQVKRMHLVDTHVDPKSHP